MQSIRNPRRILSLSCTGIPPDTIKVENFSEKLPQRRNEVSESHLNAHIYTVDAAAGDSTRGRRDEFQTW